MLISTYLGRWCEKQAFTIALDILLVDCGLKPAYLFDLACSSADQLCSFVQDAFKQKLITQQLCVVAVDTDLLICDRAKFGRFDDVDAWYNLPVVDVSSYLEEPRLLSVGWKDKHCGTVWCVLRDQLMRRPTSTTSENGLPYTRLCLTPEVNRTLVFGLLLEYPVVYWYDCQTSQENCLSMTPLSVQTVFVTLSVLAPESGLHSAIGNTVEHLAYSYSYPECLETELCSIIKKWSRALEEKLNYSAFQQPKFRAKTVALPVVAM